jgi:hypothetical protein
MLGFVMVVQLVVVSYQFYKIRCDFVYVLEIDFLLCLLVIKQLFRIIIKGRLLRKVPFRVD